MRTALGLLMVFVGVPGSAGCDDASDAPPADASIDSPPEPVRTVTCEREGTSSVTGSGPAGSLDGRHVYVHGLTGFCIDSLVLTVTTDDPLQSLPLADNVSVHAVIPAGSFRGPAEWSGTFDATVALGSDIPMVRGTLRVDQATPGEPAPTRLRATAVFDDGPWQFTATIDAPYCEIVVCI